MNTVADNRPALTDQLREASSDDKTIARLLKLAASRIETLENQLGFFGGADTPPAPPRPEGEITT